MSGVTDDETTAGSGRSESPTERADRKWNDMLQELRVIQTGAQLTAGFLLTLPFQQRFADLTDLQRDIYLGLVVLAATITALVLSPVAIHRRLSGEQVKDRLVAASHVIMRTVLVLMGLLVAGIVAFIFDVVVDRTSAYVAGGAILVLLVAMLGVVPRTLVPR
jgi:L-cystine uptake protein TcyP (sodium:dicarboxylate symporter family)